MRLSTNLSRLLIASLAAIGTMAHADEPVLRDLESKSPKQLSKDEASELLTGARISRVSQRGNTHLWTNDPGGSFVLSSAGGTGDFGRAATARGKWNISDDGRYCVFIEWRGIPNEEWCRFILQTTDGYYAVRSDLAGTERVYKMEIKK